MGTKHSGVWPTDSEPSWTDETLPLDVRRRLLDKALDRIKARKGARHPHPDNQSQPERPGEAADHPGESGSEPPGHSA